MLFGIPSAEDFPLAISPYAERMVFSKLLAGTILTKKVTGLEEVL